MVTVKLDLVRQQNVERHLLLGWAAPEDEYSWAVGQRSVLLLPRPLARDDYALELRLFPFTTPRLPAQRLTVRVNGTALATVLVRRDLTLELLVPWAAIEGAAELRLELDHPDAGRPIDHGVSGDLRELSLAVRSVALRGFGTERAVAEAGAAVAGREDPGQRRALAMGFESLGINCELGNVQRACGAEPLGLLRWAHAPLPALLAALAARFEGIGSRDTLQVGLRGEEYYVSDTRYGLGYHTWRYRHEMTEDAIAAQESRRIGYLARKLVEDLTLAEKIFVFHDAGRSGEAEMRGLATALHAYGRNRLLWVTLAERAEQVGQVTALGDGLMQGFVDRFAPLQQAVSEETAIGSWIAVIRGAAGLGK